MLCDLENFQDINFKELHSQSLPIREPHCHNSSEESYSRLWYWFNPNFHTTQSFNMPILNPSKMTGSKIKASRKTGICIQRLDCELKAVKRRTLVTKTATTTSHIQGLGLGNEQKPKSQVVVVRVSIPRRFFKKKKFDQFSCLTERIIIPPQSLPLSSNPSS